MANWLSSSKLPDQESCQGVRCNEAGARALGSRSGANQWRMTAAGGGERKEA